MAHRLPSIGSFGSSALHAELDVICPQDNDDVLWCASCGVTSLDAAGVSVEVGFGFCWVRVYVYCACVRVIFLS